MVTHRRARSATRLRIGAALCAASLALVVPGAPPASGALGRVVVNVTCGDSASLITAMARVIPSIEINLNADNVPGCVYSLTSPYLGSLNGLPPVRAAMLLNGNGSTITRNSTSLFRLLEVTATGDLRLTRATITGGDVCGGDVSNGCNGNRIGGGGIVNAGVLRIVDSEVSGNRASLWGGGIYNRVIEQVDLAGAGPAIATLTNTTVRGNWSRLFGGGIENDGTMDLDASRVLDNSAVVLGGGIANVFRLTLHGSTVTGNTVTSADNISPQAPQGGGIATYRDVSLTNSRVTGNTASAYGEGEGGGIWVAPPSAGGPSSGGSITMAGSEISGNISDRGGGVFLGGELLATVNSGRIHDNVATIDGGGIYNAGSHRAYATHVTFAGNHPNNCAPEGSVAGCPGGPPVASGVGCVSVFGTTCTYVTWDTALHYAIVLGDPVGDDIPGFWNITVWTSAGTFVRRDRDQNDPTSGVISGYSGCPCEVIIQVYPGVGVVADSR